jgi:hypothetical protein
MKITYTTKDESNKVQQAEFLALSPVERLYRFFDVNGKKQVVKPS